MSAESSIWRDATLALVGIVTGSLGWFLRMWKTTPTKSEVHEMIEERSPWARDKSGVMGQLGIHEKALARAFEKLDSMEQTVRNVDANVQVLLDRTKDKF